MLTKSTIFYSRFLETFYLVKLKLYTYWAIILLFPLLSSWKPPFWSLFLRVWLLSVEFSCSVMSISLRPHESQHARPPCPSPTPGVHSDSRPSGQWCHPAISSLCHSLLLPSSIFPSIRVFSSELVLHIRWAKYWSFIFSINSSNEYSGLISIKMNWLELLAVEGTLKSLLQHHSSKASILRCSAFFIVQLSHP